MLKTTINILSTIFRAGLKIPVHSSRIALIACLLLASISSHGSQILIPMDASNQENHLKAYGIAYWVLDQQIHMYWLLNYRGGSFLIPHSPTIEKECIIRGVSYEIIGEGSASSILAEIASPSKNMEAVKLEVAPKMAVYSPKTAQPWDDAVTMVLTYAEIPYDIIYDEEILRGDLNKYNWLHLHHEDFTGQYGKFYAAYRDAAWYIQQKRELEADAKKLGFSKVSQLKLAVSKEIQRYVANGGFMFAMCSATDSYDIALSAEGVDICESMFDGDPADPNAQNKLDFARTFAFEDFQIITNPLRYEYSSIDVTEKKVTTVRQEQDYFELFEFSAKWDVIPSMLNQNHTRVVKGFMGQTTGFFKEFLKPNVVVLGEMESFNEARYIHGEVGKGFFTFYGGHDPEDYQHRVGDPPTDLNLHPNSPGYRLILNNVLFPAAKKKPQKT
jgi:hypothetical protein